MLCIKSQVENRLLLCTSVHSSRQMSAAEESPFQMEAEPVNTELGATTDSSGTPQRSVPVAQRPFAVKPDIAVVKTEAVDHGTSIDTEVRDSHPYPMLHNPSVFSNTCSKSVETKCIVCCNRTYGSDQFIVHHDGYHPNCFRISGQDTGSPVLSQETVALRTLTPSMVVPTIADFHHSPCPGSRRNSSTCNLPD